MGNLQPSTSQIARVGILKLCSDFTHALAPLGFTRTRSGSRAWQRQQPGYVEHIYLHRCGSSYGAPRNNSVALRVQFSIQFPSGAPMPVPLYSDPLRDSNGRAYHLRFNALSWSTYDRCLADLKRIVQEHALPWFERQKA